MNRKYMAVVFAFLLAGCVGTDSADQDDPTTEEPVEHCVQWEEHATATLRPGHMTDHHPLWRETAYTYVKLHWAALASELDRLEINATWDDKTPNPEALWMQVADGDHDPIATTNGTAPLAWTIGPEALAHVKGPTFHVRVSVASTEPTPLDVGAGVAVTETDVHLQVTQVVC